MTSGIRILATRILLFVMLATFLSPSLGWQMIASHEQLAHAGSALPVITYGDDHAGHDDQSDAHGAIGHLLTHMPMDLLATATIRFSPGAECELRALPFSFHDTAAEAPFRPPRSYLSV